MILIMFLKNLKLLKDITFQNILISLNIAYGKVHDKDINKCKVIGQKKVIFKIYGTYMRQSRYI